MIQYRHDLLNDRWIIENVYKGMRSGFFIEAGATNGINGSGTLVLEREYGWDGICVEPIDPLFNRVTQWRKCKADNRALYSKTGTILDFVYFPERSGHSGLAVSLRERAKRWAEEPGAAIRLRKETVTLLDLLKQHHAPPIVHYFCLDIEGGEFEALRSFPFDGPYKILAFSIEGKDCDELMLKNGYIPAVNPHTDVTFERYFLHSDIEKFMKINTN